MTKPITNFICEIDGCGRKAKSKQMCHMHYLRVWNHGTPHIANPGRRDLSTTERFWLRVNKTDSCWLWTGATQRKRGYGQFRAPKGKSTLVHRFAYELTHGEIPEGMEIDHLCKVRNCVNPSHLEAVTRLENMLRSDNHIAQLLKHKLNKGAPKQCY